MATILEEEERTMGLSAEESAILFPVLPPGMKAGKQDVEKGFETHEQHREYLSWRIYIMILAKQINEYNKSISPEERRLWLKRIKEHAKAIKRKAEKFPPQTLPRDLSVMPYSKRDLDSPAPSVKPKGEMVFFNGEKLIETILSLFGNVIDVTTPREIENTRCFSEKLEEILEKI